MQVCTVEHTAATGWASDLPRELDSPHTLVLAFGASELRQRPQPLLELAEALPRASMLGCSTAGEIVDTRILDHSLVAAIVRFDDTRLKLASASLPSADASYSAGEVIAKQLCSEHLPRSILVLSNGVRVNGSELIRGINSITRGRVTVTGGLAGDGDRFQHTWVSEGPRPAESTVGAAGLYGERLRVSFGSQGGWDIFGPERRITRSRANVLHELDGKPALALYKQYLGERAAGLPATALLFPLSLRASAADDRRLVRTVLGVDESDQSIIFAGDVPEGSLVQLMRANFERLIGGAAEAARQSRRIHSASGPTLAIAISCVGRRLVLGERAEEEVEVVRNTLPEGTSMVGFYSYGEISPLGAGSCDLHNQTMTLTLLAES